MSNDNEDSIYYNADVLADLENRVKISVVIPTYNHTKYLRESVESILTQTYKNIECIVVDDGSDNPDEVVNEIEYLLNHDNRLKLITHPKNCGKWRALNNAIEISTGDLVTSHDADDISLPDRLYRQAGAIVFTNTAHNLCGFYHCWNEEDMQKYKGTRVGGDLSLLNPEEVHKLVKYGVENKNINHYFTNEFETAGTSAMFVKEMWDKGIRFNPPGMGIRILNSEDSDFNARVTLTTVSTTVLLEKLYLYRRNTSTNNEMK